MRSRSRSPTESLSDYPTLEAAAHAIGYDGTLAGTYLETPGAS
ncbi:hypothetical protein [Streptomyces sp. SM12]|nr:hypothetical protein [Streptomyces sp. SM12]